jgi:hypothetical protein
VTHTAQSKRPSHRLLWIVGGAAVLVVAAVGGLMVWNANSAGTPPPPSLPSPSASGISGLLFQDRDGDGEHGRGEPVLSGWTVRVHSTGPEALATAETDASGVFVFPEIESLTPGETTVDVRVQPVVEGPAITHLPQPTALTQSFTFALGSSRLVPVAALAPCLSEEQCPDLALPDLAPQLTGLGDDFAPPTETLVDTETQPGRVLLRFASSTANLGGLLHVTAGAVSADTGMQDVQQRIYAPGQVLVRDAGRFVYHAEHHHFHLDEFESYELLAADRRTVVASSSKISFCLTDVLPVDPPVRADGDVFLELPPFECGIEEQGINTGYADYYGADLPDQWIDVTGLPSGDYWLRITVDPGGLLLESDTANNAVEFPVEYRAP